MKIPIKKTNRKVPVSKYKAFTVDHRFGFAGTTIPRLAPQPITDISKGLENPLDVQSIEIDRVFDEHYNNIVLSEALDYKNQKGDWNEWHKDMEDSLREQKEFNSKHKSIIERLGRWRKK